MRSRWPRGCGAWIPGRLQPSTVTTKEEVYVLLEGVGRIRIDDELLTLAPLDAVLVEPDSVRQLFNDGQAPPELRSAEGAT